LDEGHTLCGVGSDLIQPRIVHPANRFLIQKVMNGLKLIIGGAQALTCSGSRQEIISPLIVLL